MSNCLYFRLEEKPRRVEVVVSAVELDDSNAWYMKRSNIMGAPKVSKCERRRTMAGKSSITQPAARHGSNKLRNFDVVDLEWTNRIPECPVYHPSQHEFEHPFLRLLNMVCDNRFWMFFFKCLNFFIQNFKSFLQIIIICGETGYRYTRRFL